MHKLSCICGTEFQGNDLDSLTQVYNAHKTTCDGKQKYIYNSPYYPSYAYIKLPPEELPPEELPPPPPRYFSKHYCANCRRVFFCYNRKCSKPLYDTCEQCIQKMFYFVDRKKFKTPKLGVYEAQRRVKNRILERIDDHLQFADLRTEIRWWEDLENLQEAVRIVCRSKYD